MATQGQVRRLVVKAVRGGLKQGAAAKRFGVHRNTITKMLSFSVPPGYRRRERPASKKLGPYLAWIDAILEGDRELGSVRVVGDANRGDAVVAGGVSEAAADEFFDAKDAETVATIKDLIETRVRPAVAGDGGDITFRGYKEGIVYLNMKGSCSGCPSSTATLKHGIENLLRHFVPEVSEVRAV